MAKKKSFVIYENWAKLISECPDEQAGQLIKAICDYKLGKEVKLNNPMVKAMFEMIREILDKDAEKYDVVCEKRREAIEKRWEKKSIEKNTNVFKSIQKDTDNDNDNENDNDKNNNIKENSKKKSAEWIVSIYHQKCPSLPKVMKLTEARIRVINSRLNEFPVEEMEKAFEKVESSGFLKGEKGDWKANFDWIMKSGNMAKILEGNYDDVKKKDGYQKHQYDFDAMRKMIEES